jgi:hypothetical protein
MEENYRENYRIAQKHFINYSIGDPTSVLAKEHGLIGLTRIISCMEKLGIDREKIDLIALPDFTYTRNQLRWNAGFPYGCIIKFGNDVPPFIPLDFRPNCCGVILAEIDNYEGTPDMLQKKYIEIVHSYSQIDKSDLNRRNHFMGFYYCSNNNKYYFLIHGSFKFVKDALYYERNKTLSSISKSEQIMGETFSYLIDDSAKDYYENYLEHERLTMYYRNLITRELFPHSKVIFNRTHEGFFDMRTLLLGAYASSQPFSCPIMLAPEVDLPFVNIIKSVDSNNATALFCAPHGGGYALYGVSKTQCLNNDLYSDYILSYPNNSSIFTDNVLDLPFFYRPNTDYYWCTVFQMGHKLCKMTPIFNLKI